MSIAFKRALKAFHSCIAGKVQNVNFEKEKR